MLDVLTTTPGSPDAIMRGTNDSMPLATPKTLTEKHQAQSLGSCSQGRPPPPEVTPGVVEEQVAGALLGEDVRRQRFHRRRRGDVGHDARGPRRRRPAPSPPASRTGCLDVGDDDAGPLLEERLGDAATDAGRSPGDDGNLAVQIVQRVPPVFLTPRQGPTIIPGRIRYAGGCTDQANRTT